MKNKRTLAYIALLVNTAIWGSALPIIKPALEHISSFHYLFFRYLIAAPLSLPLLIYLLLKHKPHLKTILTITLIETVQALGILILFTGLKLTTSIEASFITNSSPIFTTLGAVLLLREKEERHELIGLILAIFGISLVTIEPLLRGSANINGFSLLGNFIVLCFALNFALYSILTKKYYKQVPKLLAASINFWLSLIIFFSITYASFGYPGDLINTILSPLSQPTVAIAAIYMGFLGSVIALPALIIGYSLIEVSEASLFTYLQPIFYIPLAVLWLKEPFHPIMILAFGLILTGVIIAEKRFRSKKPNPHSLTSLVAKSLHLN